MILINTILGATLKFFIIIIMIIIDRLGIGGLALNLGPTRSVTLRNGFIYKKDNLNDLSLNIRICFPIFEDNQFVINALNLKDLNCINILKKWVQNQYTLSWDSLNFT